MRTLIARFVRDETGATQTQYAVIAFLTAVLIIVTRWDDATPAVYGGGWAGLR